MKRRYLLGFLIILSLVSLFIGVKDISLSQIINFREEEMQILYLSRLPRLISIIIAGMGMSIAGLIMQQISRNKFVSPTTAATIDSAKLGVLVSIMFLGGASSINKMLVAFVFALAGTFLFMGILKRVKFKNAIYIPLVGMMLGSIIDSISTFFAYRFDLVQNISTWLEGDFSMIIKGRYELLFISIPMLILAYVYASKFTLAGMGEDFAINLGLNYKSVVNLGVSLVALISALTIITVGRIPFLGLIVPNIVSRLYGDNMEKNIGRTALVGAVFLLASDIFSRLVIYPYEISISLTVGIVGSVIFLYMIMKGE